MKKHVVAFDFPLGSIAVVTMTIWRETGHILHKGTKVRVLARNPPLSPIAGTIDVQTEAGDIHRGIVWPQKGFQTI